jgi:hypothetical protein
MLHSYTGWISGYKWLQCTRSTTRGVWFTVHVRKHIGANTHTEYWSARGLPTESHNWQTLQRRQQTRFWQLLMWVLLWVWEVLKTDFHCLLHKIHSALSYFNKIFSVLRCIYHSPPTQQFITLTIIHILRGKTNLHTYPKNYNTEWSKSLCAPDDYNTESYK